MLPISCHTFSCATHIRRSRVVYDSNRGIGCKGFFFFCLQHKILESGIKINLFSILLTLITHVDDALFCDNDWQKPITFSVIPFPKYCIENDFFFLQILFERLISFSGCNGNAIIVTSFLVNKNCRMPDASAGLTRLIKYGCTKK